MLKRSFKSNNLLIKSSYKPHANIFITLKEYYGNRYFHDFPTYLIKSISTKVQFFAYTLFKFITTLKSIPTNPTHFYQYPRHPHNPFTLKIIKKKKKSQIWKTHITSFHTNNNPLKVVIYPKNSHKLFSF